MEILHTRNFLTAAGRQDFREERSRMHSGAGAGKPFSGVSVPHRNINGKPWGLQSMAGRLCPLWKDLQSRPEGILNTRYGMAADISQSLP